MNDDNNFDKKKWLVYYILAMLTITFVFNGYLKQKLIQNVSYSQFVKFGEQGKIASVVVDSDEIIFQVKSENKKALELYKSNNMQDPNLVNRLEEWGVEEYTSKSQKVSIAQYFLTNWIIPIIFIMVIWSLISKSMSKRMGGNAMNFGNKVGKIYAENQTKVTFEDVAGQDEAKESLEEIVDFIKNQDKYKKIGAKLPKGALLVGPPGTGKTLLAKAIAGEADVPFFSISGSEFVQMFVGMGAARVRDLFKQAQEKSPCIVFIDEIDAIGKRRDSSGMGGNDEREQTLNQLLTEMDGFDSSSGVVILAATNRPEILDPALLRPGRFDRRIIVDRPDLTGRLKILEVHSKNITLASNVNLEEIAKATSGAAGADLANIVNEAALRAVRFGRMQVIQEDLMEAIETVIAGAEKKDRIMSQVEKEAVAYHEAGHAIVAAMLEDTDPVAKITIVPRTMGSLGYTLQLPEKEKYLISREHLLNNLSILFGGRSAEEVKFNLVSTGASNDIEKATEIARNMVTRYGMSEKFDMMGLESPSGQYINGGISKNYSETTGKEIDEEVLKLVKDAHEISKKILVENIELLDTVARRLLEVETITGEEFKEIVDNYLKKS